MAAATHQALTEALHEPPEMITASPAPHLDLSLSSPFLEALDLRKSDPSTDSSRCPSSCAPSFHTAESHSEVRRPRPTPITIPRGNESQPLFSSYPLSGDGRGSLSDHQGSRSVAVRKSSLSSASRPLVPPPPPPFSSSGVSAKARAKSVLLWDSPTSVRMNTRSDQALSVSRRRSLSTLGLVKRAQDQSALFGKPGSPTRSTHKRRSSLGSGEFDIARWREMGSVQLDRNVPYGYGRYDLGVKPTAPNPHHGLPAQIPFAVDAESAFIALEKLKIARDEVPPRSSSLLYDTTAILPDNASIISSGDPSLSSPSTMSKSLPSTKTSLSRSVRSGKEAEEYDAQRAETAQVLLDKRRMIILEIVETEINYVHALRALVHIYLPHLAVLPHLSERSYALIARNSAYLLEFHTQFAASMVDILKGAGLAYNCCEVEILDRVTREVADLFVREASNFALYNEYCAGSMPATAVVKNIADRVDYETFEKRCQYISSATAQASLKEILDNETPQPSRIRLRFKDILIAPIQRVCRYPLLLASLLADVHREYPADEVVAAVESGLAVMRKVAENADDARQSKEAELKTAIVIERLESHTVLSTQLLRQLGTCRLIGGLDVLYHHSVHAPLDRPVKVRYLAAFLYRGYLVLAKAKRTKFEVRHFLPLEVMEIIDIKEGCLPFSIRLAIRNHTFDLAATCEAEKELWSAELSAARDESTIPPFELPSSVPLFEPRSRHNSTNSGMELNRQKVLAKRYSIMTNDTPNKRHSMLMEETSRRASIMKDSDITASPEQSPVEVLSNWDYRQSQPATVFLQRPSLTTRLQVDRALSDVVSESLATARSKTQLQPSGPDRRSLVIDTKLRRRRSIAEIRPVDIIASPEVRGAVISSDKRSLHRTRSFVLDNGKREAADISRNSSFSSAIEASSRYSYWSSSSRPRSGLEMTGFTPRSPIEPAVSRSRSHRRVVSTSDLSQRARSVPPSPIEEIVSSPLCTTDSKIEEEAPTPPSRQESVDSQISSPSNMSWKSKSLRRSFSFFRKSLSDAELDDFGTTPSSPIIPSQGSTTPPQARTSPSTPETAPQTPRRRRSVRLLGQLRGFTPI